MNKQEASSEGKILYRPSAESLQNSNISRFMKKYGIKDYETLLLRSTHDASWFWDAIVKDLGLEFSQPYSKVFDISKGVEWSRWFLGGKLNIVHNCVDRHAKATPDKTCLIWHGEDGEVRTETFFSLNEKVTKLATSMKHDLGVEKGDRIVLYLPMLPETIIAFLACLKLGCICVPIFSGFGPAATSSRVNDVQAKVVFTSDGSFRKGKLIENKENCDLMLEEAPSVQKVVVVKRAANRIHWNEKTDVWWDDLLSREIPPSSSKKLVETEAMDSEEYSLILYTSGTTGKPKGSVHTHAGALVQCAKEVGYCFDLKKDDVFFWVTDIGWMMGPWMIIGGLSLGSCILTFEGAIDYPSPDRLWKIVDDFKVSVLGVSPTAIRSLARYGDHWPEKYKLSSLRILGSTGEPWDRESWMWYFEKIGRKRCPIINISGGTEIIGALLAPLPINDLKPCTLRGPSLGMDVDVFDEEGRPVRGKVGYLVCKKPAPSMTRGFWKDNERYLETYWRRFPGVWYHGDWASVDSDGFWFLHGRADDVIKVAGRRLGPAEVESVLLEHPFVSEVAAIGAPNEIRGEGIVCFVVLKHAGSEKLEKSREDEKLRVELKSFVESRVGKAFSVEEIFFVNALPKTRSGKIVRGLIRRRFLGEEYSKDLSSLENPESLEEIPRR